MQMTPDRLFWERWTHFDIAWGELKDCEMICSMK